MGREDKRVYEDAQEDEEWGKQVRDGSIYYDQRSPEWLDNEIAERVMTGIGGYDTERVGREVKELKDGRVGRGPGRWGCSNCSM